MPRSRRRSSRFSFATIDIPSKANRVLNVVLAAMLLIIVRIWHLAYIQHDEKWEEALKPRNKVVIEPAKRATIRDRFNIALAQNKIQYQVTIVYSELRQIPTSIWRKDSNGIRKKKFIRKEYISRLSQLLARELELDPERIEDLIHSKASLHYHVPFIIRDDVSEQQYYRLKMLEKDWRGIHTQCVAKRVYPQGRTACDILGYMGAIDKNKYLHIMQEMRALRQFLSDTSVDEVIELPPGITSFAEAEERLRDLEEKAYTLHDYVGKAGIEGIFDEQLRGFHGRKIYEADAKGNYLREHPGSREPISGKRFLLTISSELQQYAEQLLAQNEHIRTAYVSSVGTKEAVDKQPWIKGGAIVVMDPNNGDILALASYPRYDPNDFIVSGSQHEIEKKRSNIKRWFENEEYLADIWDQRRPLEREHYDALTNQFFEEVLTLSWDNYLKTLVSKENKVLETLKDIGNLSKAIDLQKHVENLLALSGQSDARPLFNILYDGEDHVPFKNRLSASEVEQIKAHLQTNAGLVLENKKCLDSYIKDLKYNYDKLLVVDLCRLAVEDTSFSSELLHKIGMTSLASYRDTSAAMVSIMASTKKIAKEQFHSQYFKKWRTENEKGFLKTKRLEEKEQKKYPKPYIDYLDSLENELFQQFWDKNRWYLVTILLQGTHAEINSLSDEENSLLLTLREYFEEKYQEIARGSEVDYLEIDAYHTLQSAISSLPTDIAINYMKTMRGYKDLNRPLYGYYARLRNNRNKGEKQLEKHLAAAFYPRFGYGYGRSQAYRQAATQGSLFKLVTSYAALAQRYAYLKNQGQNLNDLNPFEMVDQLHLKHDGWYVGYSMDGTAISQNYKGGRLPRGHSRNIGRVDLIKALEVSSNPYFSLLAGDVINDPSDLANAASLFSYGSKTGLDLPWEIQGKIPNDLETNRTGLYATAIGQHSLVVTPLQTAIMLSTIANGGKLLKPKIVNLTVGPEFSKTLENEKLENKNIVTALPSTVRKEIFLPEEIQCYLLEGMRRVVARSTSEDFRSLKQLYKLYPKAIADYLKWRNQLIGKTSTAESRETLDIDIQTGTALCKHVWFGGIAFDESSNTFLTTKENEYIFKNVKGKPELVIVVYLRYGGHGKEAAPLASQLAEKWREIKTRHATHKYDLANPLGDPLDVYTSDASNSRRRYIQTK